MRDYRTRCAYINLVEKFPKKIQEAKNVNPVKDTLSTLTDQEGERTKPTRPLSMASSIGPVFPETDMALKGRNLKNLKKVNSY